MEPYLDHSVGSNDLNELYFSKLNVDAVQDGIRYMVFKESKKVIDRQNERELMVVMRSIYLQYGRNLESNIVKQVRLLNERVLDEVVPKIIMELNQFETYLRDASGLPIPIDRGENTSSTGEKFLVNKEF